MIKWFRYDSEESDENRLVKKRKQPKIYDKIYTQKVPIHLNTDLDIRNNLPASVVSAKKLHLLERNLDKL